MDLFSFYDLKEGMETLISDYLEEEDCKSVSDGSSDSLDPSYHTSEDEEVDEKGLTPNRAEVLVDALDLVSSLPLQTLEKDSSEKLSLEFLPTTILREILVYLPRRSIRMLVFVCKRLHQIILLHFGHFLKEPILRHSEHVALPGNSKNTIDHFDFCLN